MLSWQTSTIAGETAGLGRGCLHKQHLVSPAQRRLQPGGHLSSLGRRVNMLDIIRRADGKFKLHGFKAVSSFK